MNYLAEMETELLKIEKNLISLDAKGILSLMGDSGGVLDLHTMDLIDLYIIECKEIMTPTGGYALFDTVGLESNVEIGIEGTTFNVGKVIKKFLRDSEQFVFFAVTAGDAPETKARSLMENNQFLEGYIVDLIGSGIVDSVADQVHGFIKTLASNRGLKTTNRYSPGYCSWDVTEQKKLFSLLPHGYFGITLSESSLMSPIKSISGIIGLGSTVKYQDYTCEICPMTQCLFRKTRN